MQQILITCREAAIAAFPLIPIFLILQRYFIHDRKRSIAYFLFAVYLSAMYAAVGLPDITYYRYCPRLNLIPFQYMFSAWETTLLNVLLFIPLGFFLPILWKKFTSPVKTISLGFATSLLIELFQIFTYRATDINDLMTNTLGTVLGYLAGIATSKNFSLLSNNESSKEVAIVFGIAFGVMFFIYPFIAIL